MRTRNAVRVGAALSALTLTGLFGGGVAQANGTGPEVVADGLHNPRGLVVAENGDIYVAEAGVGGPSATHGGVCLPNPEGGSDVCLGDSGAVSRVGANGVVSRVVAGLPSIAAPPGFGATGPSDVVMVGDQRLATVIGLGADPAARASLPEIGRALGTVIETKLRQGGTVTVADVAAFEGTANPIHSPDSNPVGLARARSGYLVADAGGNTVVQTSRRGGVSLVATLLDGDAVQNPFAPPGVTVEPQAVPTAVAVGPDGATYVSQLTGFPFPQGASTIWRIASDGSRSAWATGLTAVTDLAFGPDGSLYAIQRATGAMMAGNGSLVVIGPHGGSPTTIAAELSAPYGLALNASGTSAYVTTDTVTPFGKIVRIPLA